MTVMSEGLLLNSEYIKMGREEGGFQALLTQLPLVIVLSFFIDPRPTNYLRQNIVFSYLEMIRVSFSLFFSFSFLLFYVIINFKNLFYHYFFFMKIIFIFHVPGCSGMFRHVPQCSVFLVLSTPSVIRGKILLVTLR